MAGRGRHPRTWLYVACLVLCGCGGSKPPAAIGGGPGDGGLDASNAPAPAADGGRPNGLEEGGPGLQGAGEAGACQPASCESLSARCGQAEDGCGGSLDCGTCGQGELCDGSECRRCDAKSCGELGWQCGSGSDGCSGTLDCGDCSGSAADGGGERCHEHTCCSPRGCPADACGELPDGCGGHLNCGPCPMLVPGKVCGRVSALVCLGPDADAQPGCSCELPAVCDPRNGNCCVPLTCADLCKTGAYDGSDGCGATLHCEACVPPKK